VSFLTQIILPKNKKSLRKKVIVRWLYAPLSFLPERLTD